MFNPSIRKVLITIAMPLCSLALIFPAQARPWPDRSGVCYFYRGENLEMREPCIISSGYGAGAHYAVLNWADGVETKIIKNNFCKEHEYDDQGFCRYTVDDSEAEHYLRDVWLKIATMPDPDNMSCYRVIESQKSLCYRFNQ